MSKEGKYSGLSVLVIDDDRTFVKFLTKLIEIEFGSDAYYAFDPKKGFEILGNKDIDLLVLDLEMPVMDGFKMLTNLRNEEKTKDIPVIVCTALSNEMLIKRLALLNIDSYIIKPANKETYLKKINDSFEKIKSDTVNKNDN